MSGDAEGSGAPGAGHDVASALADGADALVDIQTRSLQAAAALVERVARAVDGPVAESPERSDDPATSGRATSGPATNGPADHGPADHGPADHGAAGRGAAGRGAAGRGAAGRGAAGRGAAGRGAADHGAAGGGAATAGTAAGGAGDRPSDAVTRLAEVWLDLLRRGAQVVLPASSTGAGSVMVADRVTWQVGDPGSLGAARIEVEGAEGTTEVWLHNGSDTAIGPLEVRCGPLLSPSGLPLPGDLVIDPDRVPELARRSSRGLRLSVIVDDGAPAGTYRSVVQVSGGPDLWLPLEVHVGGSTP